MAQGHPLTGHTEHETNARPLQVTPAMKPATAEPVTQLAVLAGVRGMRQSIDASAPRADQLELQRNWWIKSGSRLDLIDMRTDPLRQLAGALAVSRRLRQDPRMSRSLLTWKDVAHPTHRNSRGA